MKTPLNKMITLSDGEWLVPFKGRNLSGTYGQNFLWRYKSLYVMDNHRAALWCWLQHINPNLPHSLLHMDWHSDALQSRLDEWLRNYPDDVDRLTIDEYLGYDYEFKEAGIDRLPLFRWDNYLSIYLAKYGNAINQLCVLTHGVGDKPNHPHIGGSIWDVPENMAYWLDPKYRPWIVNIDLDYFFWHDEAQPGVMVSDSYIDRCLSQLSVRIKDQTVAVTTIALTPDEGFTGGWAASESVARKVLGLMGVDFRLP